MFTFHEPTMVSLQLPKDHIHKLVNVFLICQQVNPVYLLQAMKWNGIVEWNVHLRCLSRSRFRMLLSESFSIEPLNELAATLEKSYGTGEIRTQEHAFYRYSIYCYPYKMDKEARSYIFIYFKNQILKDLFESIVKIMIRCKKWTIMMMMMVMVMRMFIFIISYHQNKKDQLLGRVI